MSPPGTADRTREPLSRRMAVARGRLVGHTIREGDADRAADAAVLAVRHAAAIMPRTDAVVAQHVDATLAPEGDDAVVTVTVQSYTRSDLAPAARLGAAAALIAIAGAGGKVTDVDIVQVVADA